LAYVIVFLQHAFLKSCVINKHHSIDDSSGDDTFYNHLFKIIGFNFNPKSVKIFARKILYPSLSIFTLIWQIVLGNEINWW